MKIVGLLLLASAVFAQTQQPNVTNAHFEARAFSGSLDSQLRSAAPAWFGYAVKTTPGDHENCCWDGSNQSGCWLEGESRGTVVGPRSNGPVQLEGPDAVAVLFRVENNAVAKVHVYSLSCALDAGGLPFVWLNGVPEPESLTYLEALIAKNASNRVTNGAVFAISQHDGSVADDALIRLAKNDPSSHVRGQALFWLAQKAGRRAAATITDAIENDPDTQVKKRAVFALSQLPKDEGIPKLIEVARTQKNPEVRKQAFFWLGQSHDPRALAFIEQVLTK